MIRPTPSNPVGFSLVEVVIALGVVSFAIVAILAFFPVGLKTNRSSAAETRAAQITRAVTGSIDSQCSTFNSIKCYGLPSNLDLTSLNTMSETTSSHVLYASYKSPNQPVISATQDSDSIYSIELRFDNDPSLTPSNVKLGAGKVNLIQIRVFSLARAEGPIEFFFLARNKG